MLPQLILSLSLAFAASQAALASNQCEVLFNADSTAITREAAAAVATLSKEDRAFFESADEAAMNLVGRISLSDEKTIEHVEVWLSELSHRQVSGAPLTLKEHSALMYVYQTKLLAELGNDQIKQRLNEVLKQSWLTLTGKVPTSLVARLPLSFLYSADAETRAFYKASLRGEIPRGEASTLLEIAGNYTPIRGDGLRGLAGMTLVAVALKTLGAKYVVAPIMAGVVSTLAEYIGHRFVGHAKGVKVSKLADGGFKRMVQRQFMSHGMIHHGRTYKKEYNVQFENDAQREEIDAYILKTFGEKVLAETKDKHYGLRSTTKEMILSFVSLAPVNAAIALVFGFDPFLMAELTATSVFYVGGIHFIHPYVHLSKAQLIEKTKGKPITRWFMQTRYASLIAGTHHVHTRDQSLNFSFAVLFGDMMGGTFALPTMRDFESMRRRDLVGYAIDRPPAENPIEANDDLEDHHP